MLTRDIARDRLGRSGWLWFSPRLVLATLLAILLPLGLGPALAPLARALGAADEHACTCGMRPGTCGCPECARQLGDDAFHRSSSPALGSCDDRGPRTTGRSSLPVALVTPRFVMPVAPVHPPVVPAMLADWRPLLPAPPPTPPPRSSIA